MHRGTYLGFRHQRRLPDINDLRTTWDDPVNNVTIYYDADPYPVPSYEMDSLWNVGNTFVQKVWCNTAAELFGERSAME